MNDKPILDHHPLHAGSDAIPELELSDADIKDAMRHIPGYLDISTQDFRAVYHLAHQHALEHLFQRVRAANLMLTDIHPLHPDQHLDEAARSMVAQGRKSLPVVDATGRVVGILTENDFLRQLKADSLLELMLRLVQDSSAFSHRCHETKVAAAMTPAPISITTHASFRDILKAFHRHDGRAMPVVDDNGRLQGLLLRKHFIKAHHLEDLV